MAGTSAEQVRVEVSRDLRLVDVVGLGVGAMVGAGIFVLLAPATQMAGMSTLAALALAAVVVLLSAASYAELATVLPRAGGGYLWAREGLPPPSGFLTGWIAWAGHSAALALSAASLAAFALFGGVAVLSWAGLIDLTSVLSNGTYPVVLKIGAFLVISVFIALGSLKVRFRARRLPIMFVLKLSLLLAFLVAVFIVSFVAPPSTGSVSFDLFGSSGLAGIPLAIGFTFVAYEGYEIIAMSALEVKDPGRTIPRGILISVGLVVLLYVLLEASLVLLAGYGCTGSLSQCSIALPRGELSLPLMSLNQLGIGGSLLLVAAGLVAMGTAVRNNLSSAARLSFVMAKDGTLPRRLGGTPEGGGATSRPFLASGFLAVAIVFLLDIAQIAMVASILYLILFAFVDAALIANRRRNKERAVGFRVPFVPVIPIIGIITNVALAAALWDFPVLGPETLPPGRIAWDVVALWIVAGLFYHYFTGGSKLPSQIDDKKRQDLSEILAEGETKIDLQRYRVFVPLREFSDLTTVRFGAEVAKARNGELSLLNVVEIPRNLPPRAIRFHYVNDRIKELERLTRITRKEGVDTRASVKIGHKVYEIIIDTLSEEDVNLLVLGWRGEKEAPGRILGSNIDYLVETAPCDVVVYKTKGGLVEKYRRILLIAGSSFSFEGVSDLALIVAKNEGAEVHILVLGGHESEVEASLNTTAPFCDKCKQLGVPVTQKVVVARDVEREIRRESLECDVVFISSPRPRGTRKLMLSPLEQKLARVIDKPVLLYRKGAKQGLAM